MFKYSKNTDTSDDILPTNKSNIPVNTDARVPSPDIIQKSCLVVPRPDSIDEMDAQLYDNNAPIAILVVTPIMDEISSAPGIDTQSIQQ